MSSLRESLWQDLEKAGIVSESSPPDIQNYSPWYIRVMLGITGWIAAVFILGFLAVGLEFIIKSATISIISGTLFVLAAYAVFKSQQNDFAEQFALAISLAGQALIVFALMDFFKWNTSSSWFLIAVIQATLAILMPNTIQRLLAGYLCGITLHIAFIKLGAPSITPTLATVSVVMVWLNEYHWFHIGSYGSAVRHVGYGICIALLQMKGQMLFEKSMHFPIYNQGKSILILPSWLDELATGILLITVVGYLMHKNGESFSSRRMAIALLVSSGIAAASFEASGIATGILILLLGYANSNRILFGLGIASLLFYTSAYYYNLEATLLEKSVILALTGTVLLLARFIVCRWVFTAEEKADV